MLILQIKSGVFRRDDRQIQKNDQSIGSTSRSFVIEHSNVRVCATQRAGDADCLTLQMERPRARKWRQRDNITIGEAACVGADNLIAPIANKITLAEIQELAAVRREV